MEKSKSIPKEIYAEIKQIINKKYKSFMEFFEEIIKIYKNYYKDKLYEYYLIELIEKTNMKRDLLLAETLIKEECYNTLKKIIPNDIKKQLIDKHDILNYKLTDPKITKLLPYLINKEIIIDYAKKGSHFDKHIIICLNENFTESELKEKIYNNETLFDFLIKHYKKENVIANISIPYSVRAKINELTKQKVKIKRSVVEEEKLYKTLNEIIDCYEDTNQIIIKQIIETSLYLYNNNISCDLIISFLKTMLMLKKYKNFEIILSHKSVSDTCYILKENKIVYNENELFTPQALIHEVTHAIHDNCLESQIPNFYIQKDGIQDRIKNYKNLKQYIIKE